MNSYKKLKIFNFYQLYSDTSKQYQSVIKDTLSLTLMLCALFVVKRVHRLERPPQDSGMASDLVKLMGTENEIPVNVHHLPPGRGPVKCYWSSSKIKS